MGCNCGGRTRANPGPMVLAKFNPPKKSGVYRITGAVSGVNYGKLYHGEVIPVRVADISSRLGLWLCPESGQPFKVIGDMLVCPEYEGLSKEEIIYKR